MTRSRSSGSCRLAIRATGCSGSRRAARRCERNDPRRRACWLEEGLAHLANDPRPRAPGEEGRWRYTYGSALVALKDIQPAERELRAALALVTRDWIRGRVRKELGKLADLAGDRPRALDEYQQATRLCRQDRDSACVDELKTLLQTAYR